MSCDIELKLVPMRLKVCQIIAHISQTSTDILVNKSWSYTHCWHLYLLELKARAFPFSAGLVIAYAVAIDAAMCLEFIIAFTINPDEESCWTPLLESNTVAIY